MYIYIQAHVHRVHIDSSLNYSCKPYTDSRERERGVYIKLQREYKNKERHTEKRNMNTRDRELTHTHTHTHTIFKNSLIVSPLRSDDTCGTGHRKLTGPSPHSVSYVASFLWDDLVVKCSLSDLPSFCVHFKRLSSRGKNKNSEIRSQVRKWCTFLKNSFSVLLLVTPPHTHTHTHTHSHTHTHKVCIRNTVKTRYT
jgi:hypothetical protein